MRKQIGALKFNPNTALSTLLFAVFFAFNLSLAEAQVCGTSGLDGPQNAIPPINTYFPLAAHTTLITGSKSITLSAVPPDDVNNNLSYGITPIKSGDLILIIQMQDAKFNFSNSNIYGSGLNNSGPDNLGGTGYTSIGNSGKFEYVVATSNVGLAGGVLTFRGGGAGNGCVNTYINADANAGSGQKRFQVVRVPQYSTLVLTSNLTTPPYNGNVGGIIAFDVAGTMKFNGFEIDASERGFRGGYGPVAVSNANNSTLYVALSSANKSVGKGEGIAGTPRYMWDGFKQVDNLAEGLHGGSYGRGAPANAGGAGNDHNAGGGGGGNGGFGGLGGMGWQGDGGAISPETGGGRPGYSLPTNPSTLIMGGGGGGGDANNATTGVKGGVGGGIILINVEKIDGSGVIKSNGGIGQAGAFGAAPDGAGGGGAGGTIFIRSVSPSFTAILTLEAKGGRGGHTENDNNNEHGPGGGGGGGVIYAQVQGAAITPNIEKGSSGKANSGSGISHGAMDGTGGVVKYFATSDLPPHLQGGGSICYPELTVTLNEINAGSAGIRGAGATAEYKLKVYNDPTGGNAGDVRIDFQLPYGFSLTNVTEFLSGDVASSSPLSFTSGATGKMNFGAYNISPGDFVELTIKVNIANNVPTGIYHASAQATYLDPTRTSADPIRKVTAKTENFTGINTNYETGAGLDVVGSNYNGNLSTRITEDVYINASAVAGECSAIIDGGFETVPEGVYDAPDYSGYWRVANISDKVGIVGQDGLQGALIRNNATDKFSLQQKLGYIKPSSEYTLVFNYRNWTEEPCSSLENPKIRIEILDAADNSILTISPDFISQISPSVGVVNFTTSTNTQAVILRVVDAGSLASACGTFVDDFNISSPLSIQLGEEDVKCFGGIDGRLIITTLIGAAGPYKISYSKNNGTTFSNPEDTGIITVNNPFEINNLKAGNYVLKIVDENGCENKRDFSIAEPLELKLTASSTVIVCNGGFSTVTLTAVEGTFPYRFSLNGVDYQNQNTFPNLTKGDYTFYVKDANECLTQVKIKITEPNLIKVEADVSEISCFGGKAKVKLTAIGGTGDFEYSMDGLTFQASHIFNDVPPGPQNFVARDENECIQSLLVDIIEPIKLELTADNTAINCRGGTSTVTLTSTGGTGTHTYSKDGTTFQSENTFDTLLAGTHSFVVKDANGCETLANIIIGEPDVLELSGDYTAIKCNVGTTKITLTAKGGKGLHTFSKDNGAFQPENTFDNLPAGTYSFVVKDGNDCKAIISVTIGEPAALSLGISTKTDANCNSTSTGTVTAGAVTNTVGALSYSWKNSSNTEVGTTATVNNLPAGLYTLTVTDDCGFLTNAVTISEPAALSLGISTKTDANCNNTSTGTVTAGAVANSVGTLSYSWKNSNNTEVGTTATVNNLPAGIYTLTVSDDCFSRINTVTIAEQAALSLAISTKTDASCNSTSTGTVTAGAVTNSVGTLSYSWKNSSNTEVGTTATVNNLPAGIYTLTVTDDCGFSTNTVTISEPAALSLGVSTKTDANCNNTSTGTATAGTVANSVGKLSYSWKNSNNTEVGTTATVNNLPAGIYTLTVSDDCFSRINTVTIAEQAALSLAISTKTDANCNNTSTGTVIAGAVTNSVGTLSYSWKNSSNTEVGTTATVNNLPAGIYTLTVTDDCGFSTNTVTISEPAALSLGVSTKTDANCNNTSTGTATAGTVANSVGKLSYSWKNDSNTEVGTTATVNNLPAGIYTLTVNDDCFSRTNTVTIAEPAALTLAISTKTDASCNNTSTGTVTAGAVTNSAGTLSYSWKNNSNTEVGTTATVNNLPAGIYTLTVGDDCFSRTNTVTIAESAALTLGISTKTDASCNSTSTGTVTAGAVTNSVGTISYSWKNSSNTEVGTTATVNNLPAGIYTLTVSDDCFSRINTVTIAEPAALSLGISTKSDASCNNTSTGTVTAGAVANSVGTLSYSWKNSSSTEVGTTATVNNLPAGIYTLTVTDDCGFLTNTVTIAEPAALSLAISTKTDANCNNTSTGTATAGAVANSVGTLSYSWKNSSSTEVGTTATVNNLPAGIYTLTVTDDCGFLTNTVTIAEPAALSLAISTKTDASCNNTSTGTVTAGAVTNSVGTLSYSWKNSSNTEVGTMATVNNLPAGLYTLTVSDNCFSRTNIVTISEPAALSLIGTSSNILCNNGTSTVTLTGAGGTVAYQYSKDGIAFQNSNTFSNLAAGSYVFTLKDANDCRIAFPITISQPTVLTLIETSSAILCNGGTSTVNLLANGGVATYKFSKDGTNFQASNIFENLFAGKYNFTVKDKNDCAKTITVIISQPQPIVVTETHENNICYAETKGKIDFSVIGGTVPYKYQWSNGATTQDLNNLSSGIYTVVVTDKNGCAQTLSVEILPLKPFVVLERIEQIKCFGEKSGKISLELAGGKAPYQISWSNGSTSLNLQNLAPGNYTYFAKDAFGCIQTKTITISQPQPLLVKPEVKNTTCKYSPDGAIKLTVSGGTQPYRFVWNGTDRLGNSSLINVNAGKYNITVIDANNCTLQLSAEILPGNCAPSADNDRYQTKEDTPIIIHTSGVIVNDIDPDDDDLRISLGSAKDPDGEVGDVDASTTAFKTKNGKVILNNDGSFTYIPNKNFFGTEYFIYEVTDGELKSNFAQVTIVVTEVNDPPVALDDSFTTAEDVPVNGSVATNDYDPENNQLTYVVTEPPSSGSLILNADGTFDYIPAKDFNGTITFKYQVSDSRGLTSQATANIIVTPINDKPIAGDDKFGIKRNGQISETVTANDSDPDGDLLTFTKLTNPTNGTLVFNADGTFVYQPNNNFKGIDQFTYEACDPFDLCDDATVLLVVQPLVTVNLIPKEATIKEGDSIKITALLTESLLEDVIVYLNYSGTAELNKDYILTDNYVSITIPANQIETTQYFTINTILDDVKDDNETIVSNISSTSKPTFVNIGTSSTVVVKDVYPESVKNTPSENPDINPDPLTSPNGDGLGNESFIIYNITKYPNNEVLIFNRWGNKVYQTRGYDNKGNSFKGIANVGILTNSSKELVDGVYYYIIYTDENNQRKMNKGYLILKR